MTDAPPRSLEGAGVDGTLGDPSGPQPPRPSSTADERRARLTRLLIIKAACETILVAALASAFYFSNFNSHVSGRVESIEGRTVRGWVSTGGGPGDVEIQLFLDGKFSSSTTASPPLSRADAEDDERTGRAFEFTLDPAVEGEHEVRVYAVKGDGQGVRKTLTLLGRPIGFRVGPGERD